MILDFNFQERNSGKTSYLIDRMINVSTKENPSIFVVMNTYIASSFKKTLRYNCVFLLPTSLMSHLTRGDIKQIFLDEYIPTIEILEYCEQNNIDIYFRGTFKHAFSIKQEEYLLKFYPEVMI